MYDDIFTLVCHLAAISNDIRTGPIRGVFSRYIGPEPGEPRRDLWISEGPHSLNHKRFIWIFSSLFFFYFQLCYNVFLVYLDMISGHLAAQEIKHLWKFTSGFIGPQILNFERSLKSVPGAPKQSCSAYKKLFFCLYPTLHTFSVVFIFQLIHPFPHFYIVFIYYWTCSRPENKWNIAR